MKHGFYNFDLYYLQVVMEIDWNAFGSTLGHLVLFLSLDGYRYAITPTLLFPALQNLKISSNEDDTTRDGTKVFRDLLIPFINNHHSTLKWVQVLVVVLPILASMVSIIFHICRSSEFSHDFNFSAQIDTSGLQYLLQTHANGLREVSLSFPYLGYISSSEWYGREFPSHTFSRLALTQVASWIRVLQAHI